MEWKAKGVITKGRMEHYWEDGDEQEHSKLFKWLCEHEKPEVGGKLTVHTTSLSYERGFKWRLNTAAALLWLIAES
jgi:hypothetical protein